MNFVYLSPHFPPNFYQFCQGLKQFGVNVLGIADSPYNELAAELKNSLTEYYKVDSMENYDALVRALGYFTHKYGKIDRIDSHNEYWLETEAKLRTDFNIQGINEKSIKDIKYKSLMKKKFIKAGLNVARGKVLHNLKDAEKFIKEVGYPVVAKPDKGVGASDTFKIKNETQLKKFFDKKPTVDYIFEEFIDGSIYTFDGLTDRDGKAVFYTSHFYDSVMDSISNGNSVFLYSLRDIPADLVAAGKKILKEFNVSERLFHFEFFRTKENKLVALEVNMRPPGGYMTDMFNFACDIDIYKEWANIVVNNKFSTNYARKYYCTFISRRKSRNYKHSNDEILAKYGTEIVMHKEMPPIFSGAMGDYGYVARHAELGRIKEIISFIHQEN